MSILAALRQKVNSLCITIYRNGDSTVFRLGRKRFHGGSTVTPPAPAASPFFASAKAATSAFRQIELLNREGIEVRVFVNQSQLVSLRGGGNERIGKGKITGGLDLQHGLKRPFVRPERRQRESARIGHLPLDLFGTQTKSLEPALDFHPRCKADGGFAGLVEDE